MVKICTDEKVKGKTCTNDRVIYIIDTMYNTARVLLTILEWWNSLSMLRDISSMTLIWSFMALSRCISAVLDSRMLSLGIRATEILKQNQTKYSHCYREQTHLIKLLFANQHDQSIAYEALLSNVCKLPLLKYH